MSKPSKAIVGFTAPKKFGPDNLIQSEKDLDLVVDHLLKDIAKQIIEFQNKGWKLERPISLEIELYDANSVNSILNP